MSQRDVMRQLWQAFDGDEERVVKAYAQAELTGKVQRKSNSSSISAEDYARRLLQDGLKKGWLQRSPDKRRENQTPADQGPKQALQNPIEKSTKVPHINSDKRKWIERLAEKSQVHIDSEEYLAMIDSWRLAWRPERVRFLLIAESHVAEQPGDLAVRIDMPLNLASEKQLPSGYCRLVYCLGYGENALCHPTPPAKNPGTWQYWDLFGAISAGFESSIPPEMPRKISSSLETRLAWKLRVLRILANFGVWLVDASIIGIYASGKRLFSGAQYDRLIRESFEHFVWPGVEDDAPEQVWVIGKHVGDALMNMPMINPERVISQPQDRNIARYRADLRRLVYEITTQG